MAKALKPLLIVLLLLSIATLSLGIMLFNKREILKGRTQKLENAVQSVARTLNNGQEPFIRDLGVSLNTSELMSYEGMGGELDRVQKLASLRYEELNNTYEDLKRTTDELTETKEELAATKNELEAANQKIVQLNETIVQKDAEIAQAQTRIESLGQQVAGLESQVADLQGQIAKVQEEKHELNDKIAELEQDIKSIEADLATCKGSDGIEQPMKKGLAGKIVLVNPDWNFVVVDVGMEEGAMINGVFLVHRKDQLIGKVRVSSMTRNLALAEIMNDWQLEPFKEGDRIVH